MVIRGFTVGMMMNLLVSDEPNIGRRLMNRKFSDEPKDVNHGANEGRAEFHPAAAE
jgi:hypothetical protein